VKLQPVLSRSAEIVIGVIVLFVFSILAFLFLIVLGSVLLPMTFIIIIMTLSLWPLLNTLKNKYIKEVANSK
jgi:hypothetical protein